MKNFALSVWIVVLGHLLSADALKFGKSPFLSSPRSADQRNGTRLGHPVDDVSHKVGFVNGNMNQSEMASLKEPPIGAKPGDSHDPWPATWDPAWDGPSTLGEVQSGDKYHKDYPKDDNPGSSTASKAPVSKEVKAKKTQPEKVDKPETTATTAAEKPPPKPPVAKKTTKTDKPKKASKDTVEPKKDAKPEANTDAKVKTDTKSVPEEGIDKDLDNVGSSLDSVKDSVKTSGASKAKQDSATDSNDDAGDVVQQPAPEPELPEAKRKIPESPILP